MYTRRHDRVDVAGRRHEQQFDIGHHIDGAELKMLFECLDELLAGPGLKAIEWPGRLPVQPPQAIVVALERLSDGSRRIEVKSRGES